MRMKSWILTGVLGSAVAFGCGDDDGGGGSGIPKTKRLNELSASEFDGLCTSIARKLDTVDSAGNEAICTLEGLIAESTEAGDCSDERDSCLEDAMSESMIDCDSPPEEVMEDCDATVAEFEACVDAIADAFDEWAGKITCESDVSELEELSESAPDEPAACERLDAACGLRGVFEDSGTEDGTEDEF